MAAPIILVSGTDTGVGKTVVSCGLLRAFKALGKSAAALKLIETGIMPTDPASDANALWNASSADQTISEVCPFSFPEPAAPNVAARAAGGSLSFEDAANAINSLPQSADLSLIEGAGGLLVPINDELTFVDLAQELKLPVLLVVGSRLGAINHAALSFEVLASRGVNTLGYVLNECFEADDEQAQYRLALESNREEIYRAASRYQVAELGSIPCIYAQSQSGEVFEGIAKRLLDGLGEGL